MECNHNQTKQTRGKNHGPLGHILMMALCCGLPVALFLLLPAIVRAIPGASALYAVLPLLCPVLMGVMMFMMMRGAGREGCCQTKEQETNEENSIRNIK